jgi:hypothetical protein
MRVLEVSDLHPEESDARQNVKSLFLIPPAAQNNVIL